MFTSNLFQKYVKEIKIILRMHSLYNGECLQTIASL